MYSAKAKSTEKLSSGYKINRAADDAAGLSISEKMRKQIRGLTQASLNAQDGISAVQTAEGALNEVQDMLQRANELAVKSANGTMSSNDRKYIQDEIDQLMTEIDRVSTTTKFNETYLLKGDGTATREVTKDVAAVAAVDVEASYASGKGVDSIVLKTGKTVANDAKWYAKDGTTLLSEDQIKQNLEIDANGKVVLKDGAEMYTAAAVENTPFGAQLAATKVTNDMVDVVFGVGTSKVSTAANGSALVEAEDLANLFNTDGSIKTTFYAQKTDGTWAEVGAEQVDVLIDVTPGSEEVAATTETVTETYTKALTLSLHVGADSTDDNQISVDIESMSAEGLGLLNDDGKLLVDGANDKNARAAIDTITAALQKVSTQRSALGAVQNRLEHTIANLDNVVENTTAAESRIRDTDMAEEMVEYSKNNILAQAGQSMLAQANQSTQGVLSLLQ